jgi:hypothetical protein
MCISTRPCSHSSSLIRNLFDLVFDVGLQINSIPAPGLSVHTVGFQSAQLVRRDAITRHARAPACSKVGMAHSLPDLEHFCVLKIK